MARLSYDALCKIDDTMSQIREDAPKWMRDENTQVPADSPSWVDWQRKAYIVSRNLYEASLFPLTRHSYRHLTK